jgi:undecaprenyl diphosphate synthase
MISFFKRLKGWFFKKSLDQQDIIVPTHVGVIMDGNGRWARKRGLPRILGHRKGVDSVRLIVNLCREVGIKYLTLYAFSYENFNRPAEEVNGLLDLIRKHLTEELDELHKNGVCVRIIGEREKLPLDIQNLIDIAEKKTSQNTILTLLIALSYSARKEIISGVKNLLFKIQEQKISIHEIDEKIFSDHLYTAQCPDPDLIIRTSGEKRLSNFLLWQSAYSELYFSPLNWPEFSKEEFFIALQSYHSRNRRYGNI